jgi:hypothetical protein
LVRQVDSDDPDAFIGADDAVQASYASGGRTGEDAFFITYYASRRETWSLALDERALRRLAAGAVSTIDVHVSKKVAPKPRSRRGEAFALWGESDSERAMLRSDADINTVLVGLQRRSRQPNNAVATAILGSTFGDFVFIAISSDDSAHVSVVFHSGDRSALDGDDAQVEPLPAAFPLLPSPVQLVHGDYVPLGPVRDALVRLVLAGTVDRSLRWTSSMRGSLLFDLPQILTDLGFTVPLARPFQALVASNITVDVSPTPGAQDSDSTSVAEALVGALIDQNAIELTSSRGRSVLCERVAWLLDEQAEGKPLRLMDLLMRDLNVADVFVDQLQLDTLLAAILKK